MEDGSHSEHVDASEEEVQGRTHRTSDASLEYDGSNLDESDGVLNRPPNHPSFLLSRTWEDDMLMQVPSTVEDDGAWLQGTTPANTTTRPMSISQFLKAREQDGKRLPARCFLQNTSRKLPHILKVFYSRCNEIKAQEQCDIGF